MRSRFFYILSAALVLGFLSSPSLAAAQGRGNPNRDQRAAREYDRWEDDLDRRDAAGPPFCRNGQGHPVHGYQWCVEKGFGSGSSLPYYDRTVDNRPGGSYERAHDDFHYQLDRRYEQLAARRPLDFPYQLELRMQKREEHDRWHRRRGIAH